MRHLLNTLFITSEDAYAALDGENIVIKKGDLIVKRFPLHNLEGIISFSYAGASPALMGACAKSSIDLVFCTPRGKFLARTSGMTSGNVLLRRTQYRYADDRAQSCKIARNFIFGKLSNAKRSLERTASDHAMRIDVDNFAKGIEQIKKILPQVLEAESLDSLMGLEGAASLIYFNLFDEMILANKEDFFFRGRNRRPPLDNVNALLSFIYVILGSQCASALESVGLDPYVGFLHRDRPGRTSLAQDLLEELRPCVADRFVLTLVNERKVSAKDFYRQDSGAVLLTDDARRKVLEAWQNKKMTTIVHPFLKEKISWGLLPFVQALLLSRFIRGDLDDYPTFLWR